MWILDTCTTAHATRGSDHNTWQVHLRGSCFRNFHLFSTAVKLTPDAWKVLEKSLNSCARLGWQPWLQTWVWIRQLKHCTPPSYTHVHIPEAVPLVSYGRWKSSPQILPWLLQRMCDLQNVWVKWALKNSCRSDKCRKWHCGCKIMKWRTRWQMVALSRALFNPLMLYCVASYIGRFATWIYAMGVRKVKMSNMNIANSVWLQRCNCVCCLSYMA